MIEFKDEILNGEPRYNVRDNNGNLIHSNAKIEMSTPVTQLGTPLNKPFFDNIRAYIESVDRYTPSNLAIINEESQYTKALFPKDWEKVEAGKYKNGNIFITYDSSFYSGDPSAMFDGDNTTGVGTSSTSSGYSHTILMDYGEEIKILKLLVCIQTYIDLGIVKLQASKDNTTWVDISSWDEMDYYEEYEIAVENPDWYRYYRFITTGSYSSYVIKEWQTIDVITRKTQVIEIPLLIDKYDTNKSIHIIAPAEIDMSAKTVYANVNNLGNKKIIGGISPGNKNVLIYNGEYFETLEEKLDTNTKNVVLAEESKIGATKTKTMHFNVGRGTLFTISLFGSANDGGNPNGAIIYDGEHNKILFGVYGASNTLVSPNSAGTSKILLSDYSASGNSINISVANIKLENGILSIPVSLYVKYEYGVVRANVSCFVNIIK